MGTMKVQQDEKRADKAGWEVQRNRSRAPSITTMETALFVEAWLLARAPQGYSATFSTGL
jgi:hypothetical protein